MMSIKKSKILFVPVFVAAMVLGVVCAEAADPIKIGVLYPISGGGAVYGKPSMTGHDMAVDELNAKGGILGRKIVTVKRDSKLNPAAARAAAKEMITNEGVDVLMGGISSAVGLAISEVAREEKVVYVATIPKTIQMTTTKLHKYVFRTAANTEFEGDAMAQLVKQLGIKKVVDIQPDYAYGNDLGDGVERGLKRHAPEIKIVLKLRPKLMATDYNAFITQIMGSGCDGVTSGLWGSQFFSFSKQAKPFGLFNKIKYITGGEIGSHEIAGQLKGDYPDNVWSNTYELFYDHHDPSHVAFQAELAKREGRKETSMWPVLAYIGVKVVAAAAEKMGSIESDELVRGLEGISISTPVGQRTIDPKTHQADTGQFWGPMVKKPGLDYRVMSPITYIPPPNL